MEDFLKQVQVMQEDLGKSLKRIRKAKGMKQFSLIGRAIERGETVYGVGSKITLEQFVQYCVELNIGIAPFNRSK